MILMKIAVLNGDGIGPEVNAAARRVIDVAAATFDFLVEFQEVPIGGDAYRKTGDPYPDETKEVCLQADAVLLGAVGAPEYDELPAESRPETGLLRLRKSLGGFANLRPAKAIEPLLDASPLRPERFRGTDLVIVRELLGGIYFGEPRGYSGDGSRAFNTLVYARDEIERIARVAFEMAQQRSGKLTSVDKANVLESSRLWRKTVTEIAADFPDVELEHLYVDACSMHLVTEPRQFDVIVTGNLFGDILSDEASVLTGSIGLLTSATVGGDVDLYEPVHGSAPDIAGQDIANPLGAIASVALMLRQTFELEEAASAIEAAIESVLLDGIRTVDIATDRRAVSTSEMTEQVVSRLSHKTVEDLAVKAVQHPSN